MASMPQGARWIRQGTVAPAELIAAITGLALAQRPRSVPIVLWAGTGAAVESEIVCAEEDRYAYALIAPLRFAPGRATRWCAWAQAPAVATYRQLGVRAYASGQEIWLNGARIASGAACAIGDCAVATGSFLPRIPRAGFEERVIEAVFRMRLEAQLGWQFDNSWANAEERTAIAQAAPEPVLVR
jgi:hypothetical protein